jgi:chaperonin GroES
MKGSIQKGMILLKTKAAEKKSKGGFIIPDSSQEKPTSGTILVLGKEEIKLGLAVGDFIQYSKYAGSKLHMEEEDYLLINQKDFMYMVKEGKMKLGLNIVAIEKSEDVERTLESGIIIPQTKKDTNPQGRVLAVGPGDDKHPLEIRVGDMVYYQAAGAITVTDPQGKECLLVNSANCLFVV